MSLFWRAYRLGNHHSFVSATHMKRVGVVRGTYVGVIDGSPFSEFLTQFSIGQS
jgi:hypothetical protein